MSLNTILATAPLATTGFHLKATGTTIGNSLIWDNGTNVGIGNTNTSYTLDVSGTGRFTSTLLIDGQTTFTSANNGKIFSSTGATTGYQYAEMKNTGGNLNIAVASSTGVIWGSGNGGAYNGTIGTANATDFVLATDNTGRMIIKSTGNVGIGTSNAPVGNLNIQGGSPQYIVLTNTAADGVTDAIQGGIIGQARGYGNNLAQMASILFRNKATAPWYKGEITFNTNDTDGTDPSVSTVERMRIESGGRVNIGTTTNNNILVFPRTTNNVYVGTYDNDTIQIATILTGVGRLRVESLGTGAVSATGGILSTTSDMNLKVEDGFIDNALDKVLKLIPRYFLWKEESGLPTDLRQLGFYAQEVNEALGEEVANTPKDEDGKWGIYDRGMIAMLTKAIQEQNQTIQNLQEQINILAK
jgi:hypothetical protein